MSRINMNEWNTNSVPYVKFDGLVNYKPKAGVFNIYLTETKESKEIKTVSWALITRRNVVLASSINDNPVTSEDFDSFQEKLYFRETVKWGKIILKGLTYAEAKERQNDYFMSNSFRLATALYLVTSKGAVIKLILTWTTRSKINEQLDSMSSIDFLTFTAEDNVITVWAWSRSQDIHPINVVESSQEYSRDIINKINSVVDTLKQIKEYKKTWKVSEWLTSEEATEVFETNEAYNQASTKATKTDSKFEEDDLPI